MQPLLTVQETADYLRISPSALYVQRHRDVAPGNLGVKVGRRLVWRPSDLERWFDSQVGVDSE